MSKLRMDIQDAPQDGRFSFGSLDVTGEGEDIDLRVSIMPSVVWRIYRNASLRGRKNRF